jgi:hypothetical protein
VRWIEETARNGNGKDGIRGLSTAQRTMRVSVASVEMMILWPFFISAAEATFKYVICGTTEQAAEKSVLVRKRTSGAKAPLKMKLLRHGFSCSVA